MQLRTRRNGGDASLQAVADAWKHEDHELSWSEDESDAKMVELAKKLRESQTETEPQKPH